MALNREAFQKVWGHIKDAPESLQMESWEGEESECGTTRCVAGWAIYDVIQEPLWGRDLYPNPKMAKLGKEITGKYTGDPLPLAAHLLGMDRSDASTLFLGADNDQATDFVRLAAEGREEEAMDILNEIREGW